MEFEVECKSLTADLGRQVHLRKFCSVAGVLHSILGECLEQTNGGTLVDVVIGGRLNANERQVESIGRALKALLTGAENSLHVSGCSISRRTFVLSGSPFAERPVKPFNEGQLSGFIERAFGLLNTSAVCLFRPGEAAIILSLRSAVGDAVIDGVYGRLKKEAMQQFSGSKPAVICVQLEGISERQLESFGLEKVTPGKKPNALELISSRLFRDSSRDHLATIAWFGSKHLDEIRNAAPLPAYVGQSHRKGPVYRFGNRTCRFNAPDQLEAMQLMWRERMELSGVVRYSPISS